MLDTQTTDTSKAQEPQVYVSASEMLLRIEARHEAERRVLQEQATRIHQLTEVVLAEYREKRLQRERLHQSQDVTDTCSTSRAVGFRRLTPTLETETVIQFGCLDFPCFAESPSKGKATE